MYRGVIGRTSAVDFNDMTNNGMYVFINGGHQNKNEPPLSSGGLLRVYGFGDYRVQEYSNYGTNSYSRIKWGTTWYDWQRIDNFGYDTLDELAAALKPLM